MPQPMRNSRGRRRPLDRLWIVAADGGHARILGVTGDRRGLVVLREMASMAAHRHARALASDRQGRDFESAGKARRACVPRPDSHDLIQDRFVAQLACMLSEDNRARQFDELVLIIPRELSAPLSAALDPGTRARVREALLKDLVRAPLADIHDRLIEAGLLPPMPAGGLSFTG
jgi:protein required for attachment to host cells